MTCVVARKLRINCGCPAQIPGGGVDKCTNPKLRDKTLAAGMHPIDFLTNKFGDNPTDEQKEDLKNVRALVASLDLNIEDLAKTTKRLNASIEHFRGKISDIVMKYTSDL